MAAPRRGELRVLCLHGYGQNAELFRARTGALRKAVRGRAELLYLDAPHRAGPEEGGDGGAGPRGWWLGAAPEPEPALRTVAQALAERGPVDGLLGFSQGAALAGMLCALRQRGDARFPFRFAVLVAGFRGPEVGAGPLLLPSLHVFGEADRVVPAAESRALAARFAEPALLAHAGGHFVPAGAAQRAAYLGFLRRFERPAEVELGPPRAPPAPPRGSASTSGTSLQGSGERSAEAADWPRAGLAPVQAAAAGGGSPLPREEGQGSPPWEPRAAGLQDTHPGSSQSGL
ncbi:esterase OVCA2 [Candoia aspera]|uniref:esterase OVCA2 n=1 Tax=Candoia aspera TaxID=51853 RepID=UPI002FD7ADAA